MATRPAFEISGGNLALDLANTLEKRATSPRDLLQDYGDLAAWAEQAGAVTAAEARQLQRAAAGHPGRADAVLRRARELREAIYRIFSALAAGRAPAPADLELLNGGLRESLPWLRITRAGEHFLWDWDDREMPLARVLWPVVRAAAELLTSADRASIRECASESCAWLFLDHSKNQSRRWCDMKVCGNRAKVRRFRQRAG